MKLGGYAYCVYMGNEAGGQIKLEGTDELSNRVSGAGVGALGFYLATHGSGGSPPVTEIAGLSILASLGLLNIAPALPDEQSTALSAVSPVIAVATSVTGDPTAILAGLSPLYALGKIIGWLP